MGTKQVNPRSTLTERKRGGDDYAANFSAPKLVRGALANLEGGEVGSKLSPKGAQPQGHASAQAANIPSTRKCRL